MSKQYHGKGIKDISSSGKRYRKILIKRRHASGGYFTQTKLGEKDKEERVTVKTKGGNTRVKLKKVVYANVVTKEGYKKVKIKSVLETKDNHNFYRSNIITKGAVIETELGKAVVLNRPSRDGVVNAKLLA